MSRRRFQGPSSDRARAERSRGFLHLYKVAVALQL